MNPSFITSPVLSEDVELPRSENLIENKERLIGNSAYVGYGLHQ